jgi:hypothetical protein
MTYAAVYQDANVAFRTYAASVHNQQYFSDSSFLPTWRNESTAEDLHQVNQVSIQQLLVRPEALGRALLGQPLTRRQQLRRSAAAVPRLD